MKFRTEKKNVSKEYLFVFGIAVVLFLVSAMQIRLAGMPSTGDEPEYIYRALSVWRTGGFHMPTSAFSREIPQFQPLVASGFTPISGHPVVMSVIAAPFVGMWGVAGARGISVLCALVATVSMAGMLRQVFGSGVALAVTAFVMLTFPVIAYTHLFYTELMMMALLATSWALGRQDKRSFILAGIVCALVLPFVHVRAALVSAVLVLFALVHLWQQRDRGGLMAGIGLCAAAAGLFLWHQLALYGQLVAGASASFQPAIGAVFDRLMVQFTEFRHGLLTVNPACLLALAGLVVGVWKRFPLAVQAFAILLVYLPPMIWGTASESWPARFWVPVMPALAVGMAFWLVSAKKLPARLAGGFLVLLALLNSRILLNHNSRFLDNRLAFISGDEEFPLHDRFDIAGFLPWDSFDFTVFGIDPAPLLNHTLMIQAALFWTVLLAAFLANAMIDNNRLAKFTTWLPGMALLPMFWAATMRPVDTSAVTVTRQDKSIILSFNCPARVRLVRVFATPRSLLIPPRFPSGLDVTVIRADKRDEETWRAPFSPVIGLPFGQYRTIKLTALGEGANGAWENAQFSPLAAGLRRLRCS